MNKIRVAGATCAEEIISERDRDGEQPGEQHRAVRANEEMVGG
ncbi:hypothetical protein [Kribbella sp. NPDC006257]